VNYPPPPSPPPPPPPQPTPCPVCGTRGSLVPQQRTLTTKVRRKFGLGYVLLSLTLIGFPIAIILWLVMPRKTQVIGVDRWLLCRACGARV
jgi:hypothetical protein